EVAHPEHAPARLAHDRESLGQQVVEALPVRQPLAEHPRHPREVGVGQLLEPRLERCDLRHDRPDLLELALVLRADDTGEEGVQHVSLREYHRGGAPPSGYRGGDKPLRVQSRGSVGVVFLAWPAFTGAGSATTEYAGEDQLSGAHPAPPSPL